MSMFGFTMRRSAMRKRGSAGGGGGSPVAGTSATTFAVTPTIQYHPNSQTATVDGSNRVLDCADLRGLAPLLGLAAVSGNKIRNPNAYGAATGSPGTMPTNWTASNGGLTRTIVATGVQNGIPYVDIRLSGTTTGTFANISMEANNAIVAANGQTWTSSNFMAITAGALTNVLTIRQRAAAYDASAVYLGELVATPTDIKGSLTSTIARQTATSGTIANAGTAFIGAYIQLTFSSGVAIDITLRFGLPVLEQTASASSVNTVGPVQMSDALGRKFWRFSPAQYMLVTNALAGLNHRQLCVFAVWRAHKVMRGEQIPLISTRYSSYTDDTSNTNRSNGYVCAWNSSAGAGQSSVGRLFNGTVDAFTAASNAGKMIPGAQLHVVGSNSRSTANGGGRFYINNDAADVAQSSLTGTGDIGAIIGGKATGTNGVTATYTGFDLYELAVWKGTITNAQSDAMAAAMVSNWSIPAIDSQLILLGDSLTECIDTASTTVIPADNMAVTLSAPGAELVPTNYRVINAAVGGSAVLTEAYGGVSLVAQRDDANGPLIYSYPGGPSKNIITINDGINDMRSSNANLSAAAHYANFVALLNTASTGYLQRGFSVVAVTPTAISGDSTGQSRILAFRDLLVNASTDAIVSQFLTDVQANTGQAFDGLVSVLPLCKVQHGGGTVFLDAADASDTTYYSGDGTHLTTLGYQLEATGGTTPQYGYGNIL